MAAPTKYFNILIVFAVICHVEVTGTIRTGSVYCQNQKCTYKFSVLDPEHATAFGLYNDTVSETGWGILNITAGRGADTASNIDIMFAAGYLEAALTQNRIYEHYQNLDDWFATKLQNRTQALKDIKKFFMDQDSYMREMIKENTPSSPYWRHMSYILAQYDGLVQGYQAMAPQEQALDLYAFQLLNGNGDMLDLINAVDIDNIPDWTKMTKEEAFTYVSQHGHCSALVKILGAYEDLFMSHSSWFIYQATLRIYKHYDLNVDDEDTAAHRVSFSSYPGFLESLDDFYLMSSNLVMLQTTNNVFNTSLYKLVSPQSLLAWHRVRLANMMARTGREWALIFAENNSGTYNNQYMVIDLKQIELDVEIRDNALWVVEQIPGLVQYGDVTETLRKDYWPSYNVPYFDEIYTRSGYPEFVKQHGTDFSYQLAPRAKIFRRDQGTVKDMVTMKHIMRYNDYKNDPYSAGDSCKAICCRGDLRESSPSPDGCYDTKVSSYRMAMNLTADIINGPTRGDTLPPFQWTDKYKQKHVGLPEVYNFNFIQTKPLE